MIGWDSWTRDLSAEVSEILVNDFVGKLWPRWLNIFCSLEVSDALPIMKLCLINRDDPTSFFDGTFVRCKVEDSDFETLAQTNHLARKFKTALRTSPNSFPDLSNTTSV